MLCAILSGALLCACALPSEQLSLPGPIGGSTGSVIGAKTRAPGVPLSDPPDAPTTETREYRGSGQFVGQQTANAPGSGIMPGSAVARANGVTLSLSGASAAEAAKIILGDMMRVNYTVSEKVQAKVTLNTPQPVTKEQLLGIFESVLRAEGAVIAVEAGLYRIVPLSENPDAPLIATSSNGAPQVGLGSQPIQLRYVAAAEMERILKSVAPNAKIGRVDTSRNLILVSGTPAELQSMRETVSVFDVDWMRGMSVAIHPLDASDPDAIAHELDTIFANDRDSPIKGVVRFVPNKRLKSIIVISSRPEYLNKAAGWIRRLDMVGAATEKQVNVYHVQNRPAAELAQLLTKVYGAQAQGRTQVTAQTAVAPGDVPVTISQNAEPATAAAPAPTSGGSTVGVGLGQGEPQPLQTFKPETFTPGQSRTTVATTVATDTAAGPAAAAAATASDSGGAYTTPDDRTSDIHVVADEPNNALIITATAHEYKRVKQILSRIDVAPNQVLLEATIAEVTLNDELKFGLRWFFQNDHNKTGLGHNALGLADAAAALPNPISVPASLGFSYFLNMTNVKVALNALSSVTDVNIVSSPTLTTVDNKKAILQVGDEVPILTQQQQATGSVANIINSVSYRNTGVVLNITPRISDDNRILLDIEQEVSDAVATTTGVTDSPTIQQRRIKTTVAVQNGESIILAGMIQDRTTHARDQIPVAGDIPLVGNLFKSKDNTLKRTELLIAITPQVIRDANQLSAIASEFRDKMNFTTRPQRQAPPDIRENVDRLLR